MKISEMNWHDVETYLKKDDRAVLPLGSTEQHAGLSLSVDSILSESVALEAARPLGIPVFPVLAYGVTPYFMNYPGTVSIRVETYVRFVRDVLDSLRHQGFRKIFIVNGHGGNQPAGSMAIEWMADNPGTAVKVSQLVERAGNHRKGSINRSCRLPCILDGELPLDTPAGR